MKKILLLTLLFTFALQTVIGANDWGKTGHRTTGEIAQKYLTKKAERRINQLLNGQSLAFVANYADDIKSDSLYDKYYNWHFVNFPFEATYESHPKSEKGDIIQGIDRCVNVLKSPNSTEEEKVFHLKMLVHFIGDLHQPLHVGMAEDRGGNDLQVQWFKNGTNLHRVWDYHMIDDYDMSYTELSDNADTLSKYQLQNIQQGSILDWMYDSRTLCKQIYADIEVGQKLGYRYMYDYTSMMRSQLQKGGIRLAVLLNDIFG
jgi:hypothetical protein